MPEHQQAQAVPTPDQASGQPAYRHVADQDYAISMMMEVQKTLGELRSDINGLKGSVDGVKTKVEHLMAWRNMILGGVFVLGAVVTILGFLIGKAWDYVYFKTPQSQVVQPYTAPPPESPPAKPSKTK